MQTPSLVASDGVQSRRMPAPRSWHLPSPPLEVAAPFILVVLFAAYLLVLWPWMLNWGATQDERMRALPGDALVANPTDQSTRAVFVKAPPSDVWAWLVQIGQDRGGFYSYDWLENLVGADIHNADRVHPEWQQLRAGDVVRAIPRGYLGDALEPPGWTVAAVEPGHWFVLRGWGTFLVEPAGASSRLIVRTRYRDETWWGPIVTRLAFGPVHFLMERRMLLGIRDRAEGRSPDRLRTALADIGFVTAAAAAAGLLARRRRAWLWLSAPLLLALAVLRGTGDVVAASAGFAALGLVLVGASSWRRRWPLHVLVAAAVLLVLLLAPDAYLAFGLMFVAVTIVAAIAPRAEPACAVTS